jgi:photosystem II stability/assembly factor-like uncharacterized protein
MPQMNFKRLASTVLTILLVPVAVFGQWTNVAPRLLGADAEYGAIQFKDGVAWAGLDQVFVSIDTGKTWTITDLPLGSAHVTDIECFDAKTAIVTTDQGAHLTRDQGATFSNFFVGYDLRGATFGKNANEIALADALPDHIYTTTDGSTTWKDYAPSQNGMLTQKFADGTLAALNGSDLGAKISLSSDFGTTWHEQANTVDFDCYGFVVDPCDDNTLYVINEQVYKISDHVAKLYTSHDRGATWTTSGDQTIPYYSGSMAITPTAFYLGSTANGILRSTDHGVTWMSINGPNSSADSRSIVAINENILLAISPTDGSIYQTLNSGGGKLHAWNGNTPVGVINTFDSLLNNFCGFIDTSVYLVVGSCYNSGPVKLISETTTGAGNFHITDGRPIPRILGQFDSVMIQYANGGTGVDTGFLHISYVADSVQHDTTIMLTASGYTSHSAFSNSLGTLHVQANQPIDIPFGMKTSPQLGIQALTVDSISFTAAYNSSVIDIIPSKLLSLLTPRSGWTVSTANISTGRLSVTLVNTIHETLSDSVYLVTAKFTALQSSAKSTTITFSQVDVFAGGKDIFLCTNTEGDYIANVAIDNSGVAMTSTTIESLSVYPDPVSKEGGIAIRIKLASASISDIEIFDVLGRKVASWDLGVLNRGSSQLGRPLPQLESGTYYLRLRAAGEVMTQKLEVR